MRTKKKYFSTKNMFVGTKKNRLNETVLLSTQTFVKPDGEENIYKDLGQFPIQSVQILTACV